MQAGWSIIRISCRWQTRAMRCITANMLQAHKVDAQCDKLATERSWQCFASKFTNFATPHLNLTYTSPAFGASIGGDAVWVLTRVRHQKTRVPVLLCGIVCVILCLAISVKHRLMTDRWTDRQTDTQRQLIPVLASAAQVKIGLRMNTNDVTGQCTAVQYKLIMLKCGSRKIEFRWQKTDQTERWITDGSVWLLKNRNRTVRRFSADP